MAREHEDTYIYRDYVYQTYTDRGTHGLLSNFPLYRELARSCLFRKARLIERKPTPPSHPIRVIKLQSRDPVPGRLVYLNGPTAITCYTYCYRSWGSHYRGNAAHSERAVHG